MFTKSFNKVVLISSLFLFLSNTLFSQVVYSNKASSVFSFTIGLTASDLLKDSINYSTGILFNGGFVYSLMLSDKINLNAELLYAGRAVKTDKPITKYRYYAADIPLYMQYKLNENIRVNVGGQFSKFINATITTLDGSNANGVHTRKYKNIKNEDYSFLLGGEIDLNKNLTIGARYLLSASTFFEKGKPNFGVFQLSFNYSVIRTYKQFFHRSSNF